MSKACHRCLTMVSCLWMAQGTAAATPREQVQAGRESTPQRRAIAEALFRDGKVMIEAERVDEACLKFQESQRLEPALGTLLYVATCYAQAGKTASAWSAFQSVAEAAHRDKDLARESLARERARQLEAHLSRLELSAAVPEQGMVVYVDEHALGPGALSTPLPIDPGLHVIKATAPGKRAWSHTVELEYGPVTLKVQIPILEEAVAHTKSSRSLPSAQPVPASRPVQSDSGFDWQLAGAASLGVAGAGVLMGSYFGVRAYSQASDADHHCVGHACDQAGLDGHAAARRSAALANAGFGIGIVALAAGSYLIWFREANTTRRQSAFRLGVGLGGIIAGGDL